MKTTTTPISATEACREYVLAYSTHYAARDLSRAITLYEDLMASHPDSREAEYSRMQIHNIANAVVPRQELLNAEIRLVRAQLDHQDIANAADEPYRPLVLQ